MAPENKQWKFIFAMTLCPGSQEDIHLWVTIIISRNYTGYDNT